jgi:aryl-alcohol dehydrogenase-like predicted oxidoreductase
MLTGKYNRGDEPPADSRFSAPGQIGEFWRRRTLRDQNFDIVDVVVDEAQKLGVTPLALSLAWNLSRPGVVAPIIGPKSVVQLEDNFAALDVDLPIEAGARIDEASRPRQGYPHDVMRMMRSAPATVKRPVPSV